MLCVGIWMWMFPVTYSNLNSSSKILVPQWLPGFMLVLLWSKSEIIYLPKQAYLIIIHRNTKHTLDMSSCHKHQQQRYHYETTKLCMFIDCICVDIRFPLTKAISVTFEGVTTHYQTLQTWIGHNATCYHNLNAPPDVLHGLAWFSMVQFSMVWGLFTIGYHALPANL